MIYIPNNIVVGCQTRKDTYSGRLAFVVYKDNKNVLRKEKSFNSWRDSKIPVVDYDNVPMSGFALNKKVGGNTRSWNPRQTYVRVYDPRGFEFEITIPNLLYILENTNSIVGKGLEGEFVYGWDGTDLTLIPTSAPEYKEILEKSVKFDEVVTENSFLKPSDLKIGYTYSDTNGVKHTYIGKRFIYRRYTVNDKMHDKEKFVFVVEGHTRLGHVKTVVHLSSASKRFVSDYCVMHDDIIGLNDWLDKQPEINKLEKIEKHYYTADELKNWLGSKAYIY